MRASSEMAMSARSRLSRRVVIISSPTLPHQAFVSQLLNRSDQRDEPDHSSQLHIPFNLCVSGPCHLDNQLHSLITPTLSPRNQEFLPDKVQSNILFHDRAVQKIKKTNKLTNAKKPEIVKKPLHTALKAIALKPFHPIAHHHNNLITPLAPVQPQPAKEPTDPHAPIVKKPVVPLATKPPGEISDKPSGQLISIPASSKTSAPVIAKPAVQVSTKQAVVPSVPTSSKPSVPAQTNEPAEVLITSPTAAFSPAQPPTSREPSSPEAVGVLSSPEKAELPMSNASAAQPNNIPLGQDPAAQKTTLTNVEITVPQLTQIEVSTKLTSDAPSNQGSTLPTANPPASQDSTALTTDLPPDQGPSPPVPLLKSPPSAKLSTTSTAPLNPPPTSQGANAIVSPFDGTNALDNANFAVTTLKNGTLMINGKLLNNGTTSINSTSGNIKTNFNDINSGKTAPNAFAIAPSTHHTGAAVGGVFGSVAFIALVTGLFIIISRRRRFKKADSGFGAIMDTPANGSADDEKTITQGHSGISSRPPEVNPSFDGLSEATDEPMMSPVDPVTRFSQGGFSLLKRLEGITESLNRFETSASIDGGSNDDEPITMVDTPMNAEFNPHPYSISQLKGNSEMGAVESAMSFPLLLRIDSDGSVDAFTVPNLNRSDSQISHKLNSGIANTDNSYATGGLTSSHEEIVKFQDGNYHSHEESTKAGSQQAWWGTQPAVN